MLDSHHELRVGPRALRVLKVLKNPERILSWRPSPPYNPPLMFLMTAWMSTNADGENPETPGMNKYCAHYSVGSEALTNTRTTMARITVHLLSHTPFLFPWALYSLSCVSAAAGIDSDFPGERSRTLLEFAPALCNKETLRPTV